MSKYRFKSLEEGYEVYTGKTRLGVILPSRERGGRHAFYLAASTRKKPRMYRGKEKAAKALHEVSKLLAESKKQKWTKEQLVISAWDSRPTVANQYR